jgi:sugar transferase (PEP-CTERM/EpsH1 system associated)
LFLANRIPYPPYRGDKLKIYNLAIRLAEKHELILVTFTQTEEDKKYKDELLKVFKEVHLVHLPSWRSVLNCIAALWSSLPLQVLYFQSPSMRRLLNDVLRKHTFDAIHVQHLRMAPYLSGRKDLKRILDLPDAFSLYWERRKKIRRGFLRRAFENIEQKRVLRYENVIKDYQLSLVCSQEDLTYLQNLHHVKNIRLLPNGVDLTTFYSRDHDYTSGNTLLFTGNMDYAPNVDAVVYFVTDILPLIHLNYPDTTFIIAGQRPVEKVLNLASDKVIITGFVKDLAEIYNSASVVVAPLRFGAGTQNKVIEAMAMGVPVVCTNIGFLGLGIHSGEGAIMQIEADKFAASVCDLLGSSALRRQVGEKGMSVVRTKFDWDVVAGTLKKYFEEIA